VKREIKYQPPKIAVHSCDQNERIRRMESHLKRTKEKFKEGLERSAHLGVEANGVLAGPTRNSKK
jgi:hypothetical protein